MDFPSATATQHEQLHVERKVEHLFKALVNVPPGCQSVLLELWRDRHIDYLLQGIRRLSPNHCVLDANRSWLCYWILNSIALLGEAIDTDLGQCAVDFLHRCQDPNGGYAGGPGQMPHLATTYAAVNALVTIGGETALASVNREKMLQFLLRMKDPSGGFRMHDAGEMDVRGCYTAVAVASMLKILVPSLVHNLATYVVSCQTYEGGIAGEPGAEAHGGYTFCGLATLVLINEAHRLDLPSLLDWVVFRQGRVEGGFQGRTNKLVDGCYSFWQGGAFPLFQRLTDVVHQQLNMSYVKADQHDAKSKQECIKESAERVRVVGESNAQQLDAIQIGFIDEESNSTVTAEKIFPVIDCFRKTSLHIEIVEEGQAGHSSSLNDSMPSMGDSGLSFLNKDIKCGPLFNTHALQGYILLCSQNNGIREQLQSCRVSRLSVKATNESQNPAQDGNGGKRIWRRRRLKKDITWNKRERTPFLEEQVIRMRGGDKQMSIDIDRLMNQADNKYEFVLDIAAEATEYQVNDPDAFVSMQPMAKVISDRMNEAGFERMDGYDYDKYIRELER